MYRNLLEESKISWLEQTYKAKRSKGNKKTNQSSYTRVIITAKIPPSPWSRDIDDAHLLE